MAEIQFAAQAYQSHALQLNAQQCINMYVEKSPPGSTSTVPVFGSAGLTGFATCFSGTGAVYDLRIIKAMLYATTTQGIFSVQSNGTTTQLAAFTPRKRVCVANNETQIAVVDGTNRWVYGIDSGTLTNLTGQDGVNPANTITYFDTYFITDYAGTNQFDYTNPNDATAVDPLNFYSCDADPDVVMAAMTLHEQLILPNAETIEFWWDAGILNNPFQRIQSTLLQRGMIAPLGFVKEDNTIFFLGDDGIFYRLQNFFPLRVSQHAVEKAWQSYPTMADAFCFSYTQEGHKFVTITFPSGQATWVLDISTGLWHQRESWNANNASYGQWRGNCACEAYGHILIGDAFTGQIGISDFDAFTEYGNTMRGLVTAPPIQQDRKRIFLKRFELQVSSGVGLSSGNYTNPKVMLDWSDDGGETWGPQLVLMDMGAIGQYTKRLYRRRLGQSRARVLRLSVTDPVRRNFIGTYVDLQAGIG